MGHVDASEGVVKRGLLHRSVHIVPFVHSSGHHLSGVSMGPGNPGSAWEDREGLVFGPCDPIDGSPPGSPIPGILQARTLEWVAISFSNA